MAAKRAACRLLFPLAVLLSLCCLSLDAAKATNNTNILDGLQNYSTCIVHATFSFIYSPANPPKSEAELKALCKTQSDAFKCLKDKTRGSTIPLIRRALVSYASSRAKDHKKYCTNTASEQSRKFLAATKCVMEKRFGAYRDNDAELLQTLLEVARRNYTDAAVELKRICCSFHTFKNNFGALVGAECAPHKPMIEELAGMVVSEELGLICEDDDKLAKVCPKLEPLQFKRVPNYRPSALLPASTLTIYLLSTIGEPNDPSIVL